MFGINLGHLNLFVAWVLLAWLQAVPELGITGSGVKFWAVQFADDCVVLLPTYDKANPHALLSAMNSLVDTTGQHLNTAKRRLVPLGALPPNPPLPSAIYTIPVSTTAATLGMIFQQHPPTQQKQK